MKVSLKEGFDFTPLWNDNMELEESKRIKVKMRFQTGLDMTDAIAFDGTVDKVKDWLSICQSVENLEVNGKKATPIDICKIGGLAPLYLELKAAYRKETAIDKKK